MIARLVRNAGTVFGTFGYLDIYGPTLNRLARFCTAEDDWLDNKPSVSCIPSGLYLCRAYQAPTHGPTWEITGVPGRSAILFHAGNTEEDVKGCVVVGTRFGSLKVRDEDDPARPLVEKWGVVESRAAFQRLREVLHNEASFPLEVVWDFHGWRQ